VSKLYLMLFGYNSLWCQNRNNISKPELYIMQEVLSWFSLSCELCLIIMVVKCDALKLHLTCQDERSANQTYIKIKL
jgi:hypothetical protein